MNIKVKLDEGARLPEKAHDADWYNVECLFCGTRFHLKPCAVKRFKTHYCSKDCQNKARSIYMKGEGNHQYGLKGELNASWKGETKKFNSHGYVMIRIPEHPFADKNGWAFEHRWVAEQYMLNEDNSIEIKDKRYLKPEYHVHHINFDRTDNRVENLIVMHKEEHRKMHNRLNPSQKNDLGQFVGEDKSVVKIKRVTETARLPEQKSEGAAGYDLYADISEPIHIYPHDTAMIGSGIAMEIPKGFFGAIYARSGLSVREGLRPATCVSVIDSDYRGEIGLPIHNDSEEIRVVEPHSRVAQIVIQKVEPIKLIETDSLDPTERGDGGFGSTGR